MTQDLLHKAKDLLKEYKENKKEKKSKGELFNIFSIMRMEYDEVYTHSAVIAEFLNPKGLHGSGDIYLKMFLQSIPFLQKMDFNTTKAEVEIEYTIGNITPDYKQGGRIDILLRSEDKAIIIENKIYAEDQEKQLYRYMQYAQSKNFSDYHILYLTLGGKPASIGSLYKMASNDYIRISYRETINDWLEKCIEKSADKPLVRETLIQYHNLIDELTRKKSEEPIIQEISSFCKNADDLIALKSLDLFDNILSAVLHNVLLPQLNNLAQDFGLVLEENGYDWNHKYKAFSFLKKDEWETFEITFLFGEAKFSELRCGFRYIYKRGDNQYPKNNTYNQLVGQCGTDKTPRWPSYHKCQGYSNWKNNNVIEEVYDGRLINRLRKDLKDLLKIAEENHLSL